MKYILKYHRYHMPYHEQYENLESAIDQAFWIHDSGEGWPKCIVDEEDNIIMTHNDLLGRFSNYD